MKDLYRAITSQYWAIDEEYIQVYQTPLTQILNRGHVDQIKDKDLIGKADYLGNGSFLFDSEIENKADRTGSINVIPVKGVVLKEDTMCQLGTSTMAQMIKDGEPHH